MDCAVGWLLFGSLDFYGDLALGTLLLQVQSIILKITRSKLSTAESTRQIMSFYCLTNQLYQK